MTSWIETAAEIAQIAQKQLFFVGGAPRSGTTWLQQILNSHPEVVCHGEGLFLNHFAVPLEKLMAARRETIEDKNRNLFGHTGGYPLPTQADSEYLIGTALLLGLLRQTGRETCRAVGEKTPENVFFFPRLLALFPRARFIAIARDPRDVLTSSWHFFQKTAPGVDQGAAKLAFVRAALPSLDAGARAMTGFADAQPDRTMLLTYERLRTEPAATMTRLFDFLGVSAAPALIEEIVARTSFAAVAGRAAGIEQNGSFFRKGVSNDWQGTLDAGMNALITQHLGWSFDRFGWQA